MTGKAPCAGSEAPGAVASLRAVAAGCGPPLPSRSESSKCRCPRAGSAAVLASAGNAAGLQAPRRVTRSSLAYLPQGELHQGHTKDLTGRRFNAGQPFS